MRNIILYTAMSLDGYIADNSGGVDWLGGDNSDPENMGSYSAFIENIDTSLLRTFRCVLSSCTFRYGGSILIAFRAKHHND
jgi:dihydrofolate reductase